MNPTILTPVMGKIEGKTGFFKTLVWKMVKKKEKPEFKLVLHLERDGLC